MDIELLLELLMQSREYVEGYAQASRREAKNWKPVEAEEYIREAIRAEMLLTRIDNVLEQK